MLAQIKRFTPHDRSLIIFIKRFSVASKVSLGCFSKAGPRRIDEKLKKMLTLMNAPIAMFDDYLGRIIARPLNKAVNPVIMVSSFTYWSFSGSSHASFKK
jgi:hypothetical protein